MVVVVVVAELRDCRLSDRDGRPTIYAVARVPPQVNRSRSCAGPGTDSMNRARALLEYYVELWQGV